MSGAHMLADEFVLLIEAPVHEEVRQADVYDPHARSVEVVADALPSAAGRNGR
jgi:hypothetical protein